MHNQTDNSKKGLKRLGLIMIILVLVIMFCFLPDILLNIRKFIKKVMPFKNIICTEVTDILYIKLMLGPLFSCMAIAISILAFHTAKSTGKIQKLQQKANIIKASANIREIIKTNAIVIYNLKRNTGSIRELSVNRYAVEDAAYLYSAEKINRAELILFNEFFRKVSCIRNLHELNNTKSKEEEINNFCKKYFRENSVEYISELNELIKKLDQIV